MRIGRIVSGRPIGLSTMLAISLCLAGCGKGMSARQREEAEQENRHNAEIQADWQNLVNEMAPVRPMIHDFDNMVHEVEKDGAQASFNRQVERMRAEAANAAEGQ